MKFDYARLRDYRIAKLLKYEITSTSFYFNKDDFPCKHKRSSLLLNSKKSFKKECLSEVLMSKADFMAYARKVPVKKAKLKTYRYMTKHMWNAFTKLANDYARIDIIFHLYITYSIKETERTRRNAVKGISTNIFGSEQQLPINTKKWTVTENKMKFL